MLILSSCEKEPVISSVTAEEFKLKSALPEGLTEPNPKFHQESGAAFRRAYLSAIADGVAYNDNYPSDEEFDINVGLSHIAELALLYEVSPADMEKTSGFLRHIADSDMTGITLAEGKALVDAFITRENITVETTPIAYHSAELLKAGLFTRQSSFFNDQYAKDGENDQLICVFNTKQCKGIGGLLIDVGFAAIGIASIAAAPPTGGASVAAGLILKELWKQIYKAALKDICGGNVPPYECDDCDRAYDFAYYFDDCNTFGIRPLGSFQWAEGFILKLDGNRDGNFVPIQRNLPGNVEYPEIKFTASEIYAEDPAMRTGISHVTGDVICDGQVLVPWEGRPDGVSFTNPPFPTPIATVRLTNNPPAHPDAPPVPGRFFAFGTELRFALSSVSYPSYYRFTGWTASGGTPSSSGPQSTFTTTFQGSQATNVTVSANFLNTCNNTTYSASYWLVVMP